METNQRIEIMTKDKIAAKIAEFEAAVSDAYGNDQALGFAYRSGVLGSLLKDAVSKLPEKDAQDIMDIMKSLGDKA